LPLALRLARLRRLGLTPGAAVVAPLAWGARRMNAEPRRARPRGFVAWADPAGFRGDVLADARRFRLDRQEGRPVRR
jgi:hypothetical protein